MKAIDTNILVRFLVADDKQQAEKVYRLFKKTEAEKKALFVPLPVVLELIWVLESVYRIARDRIIETLDELLLMPILKFEALPAIQETLRTAKTDEIDLSDLLIAHVASSHGCRVTLTFDRRAGRCSLFEMLR